MIWTEQGLATLRAMYADNTAADVAAALCCSTKRAAKRGAYSCPIKGAKIAQTVRSKSRFSEALIEDARTAAETAAATARRLGISRSYVKDIRAGKTRRPLASPWAGLFGG